MLIVAYSYPDSRLLDNVDDPCTVQITSPISQLDHESLSVLLSQNQETYPSLLSPGSGCLAIGRNCLEAGELPTIATTACGLEFHCLELCNRWNPTVGTSKSSV